MLYMTLYNDTSDNNLLMKWMEKDANFKYLKISPVSII